MNVHVKAAATPRPTRKAKVSRVAYPDSHTARLLRSADEADHVTDGADLGKLSPDERRKLLFG